MPVTLRKSKMVSFRLSPADYLRFREVCAARGVQSISDLARIAMDSFAASQASPDSLSTELRDLQGQVRTISQELERLSQLLEAYKTAGA